MADPLDDDALQQIWDRNAEGWTHLSRAGYDRCRDLFNTPTFLRMLPDVRGRAGLDIGCGEGHNTRLLADLGARMTGIDLAPTFVRHAQEAERAAPRGISYSVGNAAALPFPDHSFDFATAFMVLQDVRDQERAIAEAHRVVRPGGFFQLSITHPCFHTPRWSWTHGPDGRREAMLVGDYFRAPECRVDEWIFGAAPPEEKSKYPKFRTPYFERTLSSWLNLVIRAGFAIEEVAEPTPDDETLARHPREYDARIIAYFLILRGRKTVRALEVPPAGSTAGST